MLRICTWMKGKLNQTSYHKILQHHMVWFRSQLVGQRFVLMQDNDPKYTSKLYQRYIKSKEEQYVLQLMSWSLNWYGMNLTEKSELHSPQLRLTSGNSCRKAGKNYFQSTSSLWWKECWEFMKQWKQPKSVILMNQSLRIFCVFWFKLYLMWLMKHVFSRMNKTIVVLNLFH